MARAQYGYLGGQPVLILKEGTTRTRGRDAQEMNIMAAKIVAEAVRSTLGPRGMDKMLVDSLGDVVITNDGATILKEIDVEHPAAKMIVEVAKTQDEEVGDGTTTAVVLAGELLKKAEELLDQEIHPTVIANGYKLAADKAVEILESMAVEVSPEDKEKLKIVASTALTGKGVEYAKDRIAELVVEAVTTVAEKVEGKYKVDVDNIKIEKKIGGAVEDTQLIRGIVIDKEVVHPGMPKRVEKAKIALIKSELEPKKTETDAEIQITSPEQLKAFLDEEERILKEMVEKIKESGANVVFCQKGIDDLAQHYLAKAGILAVRRVKESDMEKLSRATGAKIVTKIESISPEDLGSAELVEERKVGDDRMVFVEGCENPKAVTILLQGGTEHVVDELERGMNDMLHVVAEVLESGKILPGGGAPEIELSLRLREFASTLSGREQLAAEAFAEAMEIIPKTLAENAGLDPIDAIVDLKAAHERGEKSAGLNVFTGEVVDMLKEGVVEPLKVKIQAIRSATEATVMILRIDDVIAAKKLSEEEMKSEMGGEEF
ncbi:MAG: TCP-1/cpn60 chaperonin family protein [Archaeoglobi archaeon]|nr:TCP-1/cpn60 chaperonin family protein [Candidatus Mnemosynella sp.]